MIQIFKKLNGSNVLNDPNIVNSPNVENERNVVNDPNIVIKWQRKKYTLSEQF